MEEIFESKITKKIYTCDQCEYTGSKDGLKSHKRSKHRGIKYHCDLCEFVANFKSGLRRHKRSRHEGIRYPCDQCDHMAMERSGLKMHKQAIHGDAKYQCDQCKFVAKMPASLAKHKKKVHEGVRYPCDQCEHVSFTAGYLKEHKQTKHEMIRYPCGYCEYATPRPSHLKRHMLVMHNENTNDKGYPCEHCKYSATRPDLLQRHIAARHRYPAIEGVEEYLMSSDLLNPEIIMEEQTDTQELASDLVKSNDQDPLELDVKKEIYIKEESETMPLFDEIKQEPAIKDDYMEFESIGIDPPDIWNEL